MEQDLENFYRRLRLHTHFNSKKDDAMICEDVEPCYFDKFNSAPKKKWTPRAGENKSLDVYINATRSDISKCNFSWDKKHNNLTQEENEALKTLKTRTDIVVKPADKGGATVVWDKSLYIEEGLKQLSDTSFYVKLNVDVTDDNNCVVKSVIESEINENNLPDEASSLVVRKPKCSKLYLLPKIHKPGCPGRPIVSNINCPTELVSGYLDDIFQPIVKQLPSFVKDTTDFLHKINNFEFDSVEGATLCTMDVKSLYTVIV